MFAVGAVVFSYLLYAFGFETSSTPVHIIIERPIGDSLAFSLLGTSASDELVDIEKDLQATELRGLDDDLRGAEEKLNDTEVQ